MIRAVEEIDNLVPIKNAIISVFDKNGLDILVQGLLENCPDIKIFSSGGTFKFISQSIGEEKTKKHLQEVSEYTKLPETTGGLVKTLHHKLFLGYLTETYCLDHQKDLERENAVPIDLVVINLYPFKEAIRIPGATIEDARGNIDVGGPSALRAAAKNWHRVATLSVPEVDEYGQFIRSLWENDGCTTLQTRFDAWKKTFRTLSDYDLSIYHYLKTIDFEDVPKIYKIY